MTINTLLMILALAVGGGTAQSTEDTAPSTTRPPVKIESNCWINGVWYNPCPDDAPTGPQSPPEIQPNY
jgi:hypothetical protein